MYGVAVAAVALLASVVASDAAPLTACTASDIVGHDPGCPTGSGPCSVTKTYTIPNTGCVLDFGSRAVTIASSSELTVGTGSLDLVAGSLTIAAGGFINARGENPTDFGGTVTIEVAGDVTLQRASASGRIDVSGAQSFGLAKITAGGNVSLDGRIEADNLSPDGGDGEIDIKAGGDIVSASGSVLSAAGGVNGDGGTMNLDAGGRVDLGDEVTLGGGFLGGALSITSGGEVVLRKVDLTGNGDQTDGGMLTVHAGTQARFLDTIDLSGSSATDHSGGGGEGALDVTTGYGDLIVAGPVRVEGAAPDGLGGTIDIDVHGSITVQPAGVLSARSNGSQGDADAITITASGNVTCAGSIDASAGLTGGTVDVSALGDVTVTGGVFAGAVTDEGAGGAISLRAAAPPVPSLPTDTVGVGMLSVGGVVDASGGGCSTFFCGNGGNVDLSACDVTVTTAGQVLAHGAAGGGIVFEAHEQLTILGTVSATRTKPTELEGTVGFTFPSDKPPIVTPGVVTPPPASSPKARCTAANVPAGCLTPCPTCGNGVVEFPETCDNAVGPPLGCDGCSRYCQTENCDDGIPCTTDSCDPLLGCRHQIAVDGTPCPDGLACNGTETCQAGVCSPGMPLDCTNPGACRLNFCLEPFGCAPAPVGTACTDNDVCTLNDACDATGHCASTSTLPCPDDGNECTNDVCDPILGCQHTNRTGSCTDDGNPCTSDVCNAGVCMHPARAEGTACDDGFFCTVNDACRSGTCAGGQRNCDDNDGCTIDSCDEGARMCQHAQSPTCNLCGNGRLDPPNEECDAGAANANTPDAACRTDCHPQRCGDHIVDTGHGEQCDDGGTDAGDGCSARCFIEPPPTAQRIAGRGSVATECVSEWAMDHPTLDVAGQPSNKQSCTDGDPACDAGATAGECLFHVWLCSNNHDTRYPTCDTTNPALGTVAFVEVRKPTQRDATKTAIDLQNLRQATFAAGAAAVTTGDSCGPRMDIHVPLRGTGAGAKTLKIRATTTRVIFDLDALKLRCLP